MCHLDEAGFAPTLPTSYTWSRIGQRYTVDYEAPQGRRVNTIGAYVTHGPAAGQLVHRSFVALPRSKSKKADAAPAQRRPIHAERLIEFLWLLAGRPTDAPVGWVRERPLAVWMDNYSVHTAAEVKAAAPTLAAAGITLHYLPPYSPELSGIEPIWQDVKYRGMRRRSYTSVEELQQEVDAALTRKAATLRETALSLVATA